MKRIFACIIMSAALFAGCQHDPAELEDFVVLGTVDYSVTLSIFCLLNPEDSVQDLTVERLSPPSGAPQLHYGPGLGIKILTGDIWRLFQRMKAPPFGNNEWDHYALDNNILDINYGETYSLDINTTWGAAARGSTVVPGPFEIVSPIEGGQVDIQARLTVHWSESPDAFGYALFVFSQITGLDQNYRDLTRETSFTLPYGLKDQFIKPYFESFEAGTYSVEVWAVDKNYFDFLMTDPDDPFSPAVSGLQGASGIFGSRVKRRVTFTIGSQ
ncbi:hypothetical protein ACFLT7_02275 [candidate division KSB1 bacterium]